MGGVVDDFQPVGVGNFLYPYRVAGRPYTCTGMIAVVRGVDGGFNLFRVEVTLR